MQGTKECQPGIPWCYATISHTSNNAVSVGWAKKISAARKRTGQAERVPHKPGRKPRVGAEQQKLVTSWVTSQPDLRRKEVYDADHPQGVFPCLCSPQRVAKTSLHYLGKCSKPAEIDHWLTKNMKTGSTANRYRAAMSLAYREGIRNGKVASNPVRLVKQRREGGNVIRFLRDHEEAALRAVIEQICPDKMCEFDISLGTGMRLSEQYGARLRWHNVDFERQVVDLSKTKNYTARVIPMNVSVLAAFEARRAQVPQAKSKDIVFQTPPRPWWDQVRELARVSDYRWHDNRHTFCSRLAMRRVNLVAIKELAGHKTLAITARYAHLDEDAKREAVNSLLIPAHAREQSPRQK